MFTEPSVGRYYEEPPQVEGEGFRSWVTRAKNFAIVYTEGKAGAKLLGAFRDEQFAYTLEGHVRVAAGGEAAELGVEGLAILPPGDCEIAFLADATLVQVVTTQEDIAALAPNQEAYADGAPRVAPVEAWPEPVGGYRLRVYDTLAGYARGGMVHAYRTRKLMIVPYARFLEPRDETQLSPHSHEDFEQASVALEGGWEHFLRVPWTPNKHHWRPDLQIAVGSPSTTIMPAGVVHTSQGVSGEGMRLIDVFAPPRVDFSLRGVVDNADEYPMPRELAAA